MINNLINFLNDNAPIVLLIIISSIILSLASKRIRTIISTSIISGIIPVSVFVLNKLGVQINGIYNFFERLTLMSFNNISRLQLLITEMEELFLCIVNFESEIKQVTFNFLNDAYKNFKVSIGSLIYFVKTTKIQIKCLLESIKIEIIKKINLSSLSFVYRL